VQLLDLSHTRSIAARCLRDSPRPAQSEESPTVARPRSTLVFQRKEASQRLEASGACSRSRLSKDPDARPSQLDGQRETAPMGWWETLTTRRLSAAGKFPLKSFDSPRTTTRPRDIGPSY
jgi:hypothetical protein